MITLKDWMEAISYRITEGSQYYPNGHLGGPTAYCLDSWDGEVDGVSSTFCFDPLTQEPVHVTVYDYSKSKAYRLVNQEYHDRHKILLDTEAYENVSYIDLEVDDDMLRKLTAIMSYQPYDDRVEVELTLPDDAIFELMKIAHRRDVTLNELVEQMLREEIARREKE
jgi:hypothetical protein